MRDAALNRDDLVRDLEAIGLRSGDMVNVKASLRAIGDIEGGANTLIASLLDVVGTNGTVVTDSFVNMYLPWKKGFWRNVIDDNAPSYAGALANAMINYPGSARSRHPVQKFVLLGKDAGALAEGHDASSYAYDILRIMAERGGKNLKIGPDEKVPGVGTSHVAIGVSRIRQKRLPMGVRYKEGNRIKTFFCDWSGGCLKAFYQLNQLYETVPDAILGKRKIGSAPAKLTSMKRTLELELAAIKDDVNSFLRCGDPNCVDCALTWEPVHDPLFPVILRSIREKKFRMLKAILRVTLLGRYPF